MEKINTDYVTKVEFGLNFSRYTNRSTSEYVKLTVTLILFNESGKRGGLDHVSQKIKRSFHNLRKTKT